MKKYTVITGASAGIGYATAKKFAAEGKNIIALARRTDRLEALKNEIQEEYPNVDVIIRSIDLSKMQEIEALFEELSAYSLETWINNAGFGLFSTVKDQEPKRVMQMIDLNVKAVLLSSTLFVKKYQDTPGAQLINVSSGAGYNLYPNCVTYTGTKFFVSAFTENLAHELRDAGAPMQVKLVVPEATETEFINVAGDTAEPVDYAKLFPKFTTKEEMAAYIWQLYQSSYIVGQVDDVTYGFHMHNGKYPYKGGNV